MDRVFFRLQPDRNATSAIQIKKLDKEKYVYKMDREKFLQLDQFTVAYYEDAIGMEICDFLHGPPFIISNRYKKIFALLESEMEFKGVQLYPENLREDRPMPTYWVPFIEHTDCVHADSEIYDIGTVKRLVLREDAVKDRNILIARGRVEQIWLVSLSAAESILRRQPLGVSLEAVEVRK